MHRTRALLLLFVFLILMGPLAAAPLVTFTGNVDNDFGGVSGAISMPDTIGDDKGPAGGCDDEPLGSNAFEGSPLVPIPPSGFNIERVVTTYDCTTDTLYVGLDVCDGKIAWDADGNGNITTVNRNIVPGSTLREIFTDSGLEDYEVELGITNGTANTDVRILVRSDDGGVTIVTVTPVLPAGVTVDTAVTGPDVELAIHGLRAKFPPAVPQLGMPIRITTRSGATGDLVNEDITNAVFDMPCTACISITKGVSCSANGPFLPSVQVLRGATAYFQISVTNCGTDNLKNVVITDSFTTNGACCPAGSCIPTSINVGDLNAGQTKTFSYPVPTNPAFAIKGVTTDCVNTASVTGVGKLTNVIVNAGPVSAAVDVLVPSITCDKLVADNADMTGATHDLNLAAQPFGTKKAWYKFCVTNNGETDIDFTAGTDVNCPAFIDDFIKPGGTTIQLVGGGSLLIPGTNQDLNALFRAQLPTVNGKKILAAGQTVCVVTGPVTFDETVLCATQSVFTDTFTACGKATSTNASICLPPGGGESVGTGQCKATVRICPPKICITKEVSCSPTTGFGPSVTALRGATVYFKITVTNCGGVDLKDITISDTLANPNSALLACVGCTLNGAPAGKCIPNTFNIPTLAVGASATIVCTVPTNPAFSLMVGSPDATNTAQVTAAKVASSGEALTTLPTPVSATVNVLVPGISCSKLVADNENMTNATQHLDLSKTPMGVKKAWYKFCVTNTGETPVSFAPSGQSCPGFSDSFIKVGGTSTPTCSSGTIVIPGTNQDLNALFRAKLTGNSLPAGQTVCVIVGPVSFDEEQLCSVQKVWPDTFSACGFATQADICLPPGGGENVSTGNCTADVTICPGPDIRITKGVSCSPNGPFTPSVTALRGATVYFQITVENTGGENLKNVVVTDTMTDTNHALLPCTGCTGTSSCIPGTINIGDLKTCESKVFVCTVPTSPTFAVKGISPDATNTATVTGKGALTNTTVNSGPVSATVDILVPEITCNKQVASNAGLTDLTTDLNLANLPMGIKQAWYKFCVTNSGETPVDFTAGTDANCPAFTDDFIKPGGTSVQLKLPCGEGSLLIPGTNQDLNALFRAQIPTVNGKKILAAGQSVCVTIAGVTFDETKLCCTQSVFTDTFTACGKAAASSADICLPQGGGETLNTGQCKATVRICPPKICITKEVSCSPDTGFGPSVTALRGASVYFRITVTNCGGKTLSNVTLSDTLTEVDNALLNCTGCTGVTPPACIPGSINLGTMLPGEVKTLVCTFPTNPNFSVVGNPEDATNTASVTGTVVNPEPGQPLTVSAGPAQAKVNILIPDLECELWMDDDSNFAVDPNDTTPPVNNINLQTNGAPKVEQIWTKLVICNKGESPIDLCPGSGEFKAPLLETPDPDIGNSGMNDLTQQFLNALQTAYASCVLPPGGCVSIVAPGVPTPLTFDEVVLSTKGRTSFLNALTVKGVARLAGVCGETPVDTECHGRITIGQPVLYQAYPGDTDGKNVHYGGYLGTSGDTISAVPGVFLLVPGDNWINFVTAAQVQVPYTLKNVTLVKETPTFIQCADVFPPMTISQQGTPNIRLRWPLMYEAPGTKWTLTVAYGTGFPWDDDGPLGPHVPGYYHEDKWTWKVDATLDSMKLLLELFHEVPYATDEVPLISDETLYPLLQAKLDNLIALVAADNTEGAARALGEFEMEVMDACITTSPREPNPTGPGTGIANSDENPACCKILVDAEHVGFDLGLFQAAK